MKTIFVEPDPFLPEVTLEDETPIVHLVVCLHGIFSVSGDWSDYEAVSAGFRDISIKYAAVSHAMMGLRGLVLRHGADIRRALIKDRILDILEESEFDAVSIICHSHGTKIFAELPKAVQSQFDWVFFVGSICHMDDDRRLKSCSANLINECGVVDPWPVVLAAVRPGTYWHTGVVGFNNSPITDRYFKYGHSRGVRARHFGDWVLPVLRANDIRKPRDLRPGKFLVNAPVILRCSGAVIVALAGLAWWM
ncbi:MULTISPECIES: hypothetical protein [unclassified Marinovum]